MTRLCMCVYLIRGDSQQQAGSNDVRITHRVENGEIGRLGFL